MIIYYETKTTSDAYSPASDSDKNRYNDPDPTYSASWTDCTWVGSSNLDADSVSTYFPNSYVQNECGSTVNGTTVTGWQKPKGSGSGDYNWPNIDPSDLQNAGVTVNGGDGCNQDTYSGTGNYNFDNADFGWDEGNNGPPSQNWSGSVTDSQGNVVDQWNESSADGVTPPDDILGNTDWNAYHFAVDSDGNYTQDGSNNGSCPAGQEPMEWNGQWPLDNGHTY